MKIEWRPIEEAPSDLTLIVARRNGLMYNGDNLAIAFFGKYEKEWMIDHEPYKPLGFTPTHFSYLNDND